MTIKELVSFTGKTERTLRRWIEKSKITGCDKMSYQVERDYTIEEVEQILNAGSMSKDSVSVLMDNARGNNAIVPQQNVGVDYQELAKVVAVAVSTAMIPVMKENFQ